MSIVGALFLDMLFGDPKSFFCFKSCRYPHPVAGIGRLVCFWEKIFYPKDDKKLYGGVFCAAVLSSTGLIVGLVLLCASFNRWLYGAVELYFLYSALAWRSLKDESLPVALALFKGNFASASALADAREKLSSIVGRDTQNLDEAGIVRATVETVSENMIDGVVSVLFFMALGYSVLSYSLSPAHAGAGAVLAAWLFKAVSTLDSMVGYDNERYRDFGYVSAKLDDILNFLPARLGGGIALIAGACLGYGFPHALKVFLRDRGKHKSPNSAHGESAFAGLLGIQLGGGSVYNGKFEEKPFIGDALREPAAEDILRSHAILDVSVALCALIVLWFVRG